MELLKCNANMSEQSCLVNNIELSGIPYTVNESINNIVFVLGKQLNVEISDSDIIKAFRLKNTNDRQGKIIIHFCSKDIKDKLLSGIKTVYKSGNQLMAKHVHFSFPDTKIYIIDQLSVGNKKLFWLSKLSSKVYDFKYTWSNAYGVFTKKNDSSNSFRVNYVRKLIKIDIENKVVQLYNNEAKN